MGASQRAVTSASVDMDLFRGLTQQDLTGPYEVTARIPDAEVHLLAISLPKAAESSR
jgi:hypothetical protein